LVLEKKGNKTKQQKDRKEQLKIIIMIGRLDLMVNSSIIPESEGFLATRLSTCPFHGSCEGNKHQEESNGHVKREQESSFCEIAAADLRVSKLDRLGEGFKQVHSVGPGVEKMGSEDCERHVETKIYRADAWRICSDLNFEFCFNWSPRNG